ncbi:hypothetical protein ZYGR_0Z02390 [Zygosaccharomyces rouxii]|uniref:ZYRO0G05764p n=2 Tax=Zygosaccharomyces rouxii TaxID=4956 RepID=C5DZN0_ZYGRC|nr:uncharacterized protein ZYRO0G05764g [Zygosaccharomyces rouxii]KAH9202311.1 hypothetical protein LQ764DRAFT_232438 [Zygosaccharomyces rouxii]GAV50816.1 hypothetical protein ZYGR_0Z02390 [Zygosaccharomyces rouxii]CAR29314.1 ZYRO0G05764p [Zygosaccharomyces rouxii]
MSDAAMNVTSSPSIWNTLYERTKTNLAETIGDLDVKKGLRLVIIVGGYILIRGIAQRELAKRKLDNDVRRSEQENAAKMQEKLVDQPGSTAAMPFGWGNKTRRRRKQQEEAFADIVERVNQKKNSGDDVEDIEDLLED